MYWPVLFAFVDAACAKPPRGGGRPPIGGGSHHHHISPDDGCKAFPGTDSWPSRETWSRLNQTLGGKLLAPTPPAAACHKEQATFDLNLCASIGKEWTDDAFHTENPISSMWQQYNNDTCLPSQDTPCSPTGYPAYVVDARSASDVKKGIDFAREHNIRVVVKSTGHDYQGRSQAPGSLSIWVHNMQSRSDVFKSFRPKGCNFDIDGTAVTVGGGSQVGNIVDALDKINQTIVGGTSKSVSVGGYLTGGGHSVLAQLYGMGADQVLEMEVVTAQGDILVANECQNKDLFWAMRGGGGSTFGVMTSVTLKTHPTPKVVAANLAIASLDLSAPWVWDMAGYILSQFPYLDKHGVSGYSVASANYSVPAGDKMINVAGVAGEFILPNSQSKEEMQAIWDPIIAHVNTTWPDAVALVDLIPYPSFASWLDIYTLKDPVGYDLWVGSHLLDEASLTANSTAVGEAFKVFGGQAFLVSGNGTRNAKPRGGSNSISPSWRQSVIHATTGLSAPFLDLSGRKEVLAAVNAKTEPLRKLAPNMGSYLNENNPEEPNWQTSFWGDNYDRLLQIKGAVDPNDVFWCHPCVGNDRWETHGYRLCPVV
ncbi:FAD-binding domain-containing protein [Poronia punctata]|nr:FAD-binding domain-containing protein [Poronia punctata]